MVDNTSKVVDAGVKVVDHFGFRDGNFGVCVKDFGCGRDFAYARNYIFFLLSLSPARASR
jgi:hypothetical protein